MHGRGPRLRLVGVLMLIALLPTSAAAWAFLRGAERNSVEKADLRLAAALAPAVAELEEQSARAAASGMRIALRPDVQRALTRADPAELGRVARGFRGVSFELPDAGASAPPFGGPVLLRRTVRVLRGDRVIGRVVIMRPVDAEVRRGLAARAGLAVDDLLAVAAGGGLRTAPAKGRYVELGGIRYRALSSRPVAGVRLVALVPQSALDEARGSRRLNVLLAALATLLTVGFAAYAVPPALARDRLARRGLALIGDALAATHNARALLPVILHAAVDATGAAGAILVERGEELARVGDVELHGGEPLRLALSPGDAETTELVLYPRAGGFRPDAIEIGEWLAAQAGIALENARLHHVARQQAVTDPLTQLANRRRFIETLTSELHRTERFGSPLALILADLDNFKRINDRFGHHVGDEVLRVTARVLMETLREVDLPARIGGEEFAILLPETELTGAERLAERLRSGVAGLDVTTAEGRRVKVTASFGVAEHRKGWSDADLLRAADGALYAAKLGGKNRVAAAAADAVQ